MFAPKHIILKETIQSIIEKIAEAVDDEESALRTPKSREALKEVVVQTTGPRIYSKVVMNHINDSGVVWSGGDYQGRCANCNHDMIKDAITTIILYLSGTTKYTLLEDQVFLNVDGNIGHQSN